MANPAETFSGQIYWPSPGSFTGHQRAHSLAAGGQKLMAIDILHQTQGMNVRRNALMDAFVG
ncbi:hypothetical protein AYX19_07010 [Paenarthrobacter ureafaciens]|nr:hypothetical protein AYX19_07010 [Paenarthrobacter ureafaciens]